MIGVFRDCTIHASGNIGSPNVPFNEAMNVGMNFIMKYTDVLLQFLKQSIHHDYLRSEAIIK